MNCSKRKFQIAALPGSILSLAVLASAWGPAGSLMAQAPGVEIVKDREKESEIVATKVKELREADALLSIEDVRNQLSRTSCSLALPETESTALTDREIWQRGRAAHIRVGWYYLCAKCDKWHEGLAGGYYITADGAVATCHHVVNPGEQHREGYLIAANDKGDVFPVTEILAANELADTAIIRVGVSGPVTPLALNTRVYPGDGAWCYSDPLNRSGYFSKGMVNRFYMHKKDGRETPRMDVSTDWAKGSSGAAVLDVCGNAIGHVSEISTARSGHGWGTNHAAHAASPVIVFHCAARAADVLALVGQEPADE